METAVLLGPCKRITFIFGLLVGATAVLNACAAQTTNSLPKGFVERPNVSAQGLNVKSVRMWIRGNEVIRIIDQAAPREPNPELLTRLHQHSTATVPFQLLGNESMPGCSRTRGRMIEFSEFARPDTMFVHELFYTDGLQQVVAVYETQQSRELPSDVKRFFKKLCK